MLPNYLLHPDIGNIKQIECFHLLPVIYYCKLLLEKNTKTVNKQVINAIKLVNTFLNDSDDIAQISATSIKLVSRSLLTAEEQTKFNIYVSSSDRTLIESSFWEAEDNPLNRGKIGHLIQASFCNSETINKFEYKKDFSNCEIDLLNLDNFYDLFKKFKILTQSKGLISSEIWNVLLLSEYYSIHPYGNDNEIVVCAGSEDVDVIRHREFLKHLFLINQNENTGEYFNSIRIDIGSWDWSKGKNFGVYKGIDFDCFFKNKLKFQHYRQRWQGAEYNYFNHSIETVTNYLEEMLNN